MPTPGDTTGSGFNIGSLVDTLTEATNEVKSQLQEMKAKGSNISIVDMFQMQMKMNRLSQLSEMTTGVVGAANTAIASMARNVKS